MAMMKALIETASDGLCRKCGEQVTFYRKGYAVKNHQWMPVIRGSNPFRGHFSSSQVHKCAVAFKRFGSHTQRIQGAVVRRWMGRD